MAKAPKKPVMREVQKHGFTVKELTFRELLPVLEKDAVNLSHEIAKAAIFHGDAKVAIGDMLFDFGAGIVTDLINTALDLNGSQVEKEDEKKN